MKEKDLLCERIVSLFENYQIYLSPSINLSDFAKILEVEVPSLKKYFREEVEYSFEEMLNIFRITHAADLLMKEWIPYGEVWRGSGFKSYRDFDKAFQKLAI